MTEAHNKRVVRRYLEEVVNTGDVSRIDELISPRYSETLDPTGEATGVEGAKAHVLGVRATYPDLHITIERQLAEGEWVATCITARGTHLGEWMGIAPTGKPVEFSGVNVDRVVDDRIVEHGGAANIFGPLLEIGAIRAVGDADAE